MKKGSNISVSISPARVGYTKLGLNAKELEQFRKKAMRRACIYVSKYVKNNHDFENRTGRLQRAIHYTIMNKAKKGLLYVKESQAKVDSKYGNYSYAPFVFNGTGIHGGKGLLPGHSHQTSIRRMMSHLARNTPCSLNI